MARRIVSPSRFLVGRRGERRQTLWFDFGLAQFTLTVSGGTIYYSLNAAALALRPFTVIRSRFEMMIRSDQVGASEDQFGAFGFAIVSDQAVAVGVSAVPTPVTDLGSDLWFVHQPMLHSMAFASSSGFDTNRGARYSVDSKAMRKVEDGQDLVGVGEFATGGSGLNISVMGRMLVKTH